MSVGTDQLRRHRVHAGRRWPRSWPAPSCSRCWRRRAACGSATACRILPAGIALLPFAFTLAERRRHRAERAAARGVRVPRARRLDPGLSALVSSPESVRRDRGERLSFPDAAARHAVRACSCSASMSTLRDLLGIVPVALGIYLVTRPRPSINGGVVMRLSHHPDRRPHRADRDRRLSLADRSDLRWHPANIHCRM